PDRARPAGPPDRQGAGGRGPEDHRPVRAQAPGPGGGRAHARGAGQGAAGGPPGLCRKKEGAVTEPWFDPNRYAWVFGAALGVQGGTLGSLAGSLAPRGKAKPLIMGLFVVSLVACSLMLAAGILAFLDEQPYGVWY